METTPVFPILFAISGITMGVSLVPMIPALVLTIDSHARLNRIARNYNHTVSLFPHLSPNGIGLTLKF
jgi:formate-dependent nitrite reductase membrane component NrfD